MIKAGKIIEEQKRLTKLVKTGGTCKTYNSSQNKILSFSAKTEALDWG